MRTNILTVEYPPIDTNRLIGKKTIKPRYRLSFYKEKGDYVLEISLFCPEMFSVRSGFYISDVEIIFKEKFNKDLIDYLRNLMNWKRGEEENQKLKNELERLAKKYLRHFVNYNNKRYRERLEKRFYGIYKCQIKKEIENGWYEDKEELFEEEIRFKLDHEKEEIKKLVKKLF